MPLLPRAFPAFIALSVLVLSSTAAAHGSALSHVSSDEHAAVPETQQSEPKAGYAGWLGLSYALTPLTLTSWMLLHYSMSDQLSALVGGSSIALLVTPSILHLAMGHEDRAGIALLGTLGVPLGAALLSGALGYAIGSSANTDPDDESFITNLLTYGFAVIGAGLGYITWSIFDVMRTHKSDSAARTRAEPSVRFALMPTLDGGVHAMLRGTL